MGGVEPARDLIAGARRRQSVVTANKALLAHHGRGAGGDAPAGPAPRSRFEASVGGGIPILGPIAGTGRATGSTSVRGIVNGTTNFILTAMTDEGRGLRRRPRRRPGRRLRRGRPDAATSRATTRSTSSSSWSGWRSALWLAGLLERTSRGDRARARAARDHRRHRPTTSPRRRPTAGSSSCSRRAGATAMGRSTPVCRPPPSRPTRALGSDERRPQSDRGRRRAGRHRRCSADPARADRHIERGPRPTPSRSRRPVTRRASPRRGLAVARVRPSRPPAAGPAGPECHAGRCEPADRARPHARRRATARWSSRSPTRRPRSRSARASRRSSALAPDRRAGSACRAST